MITITIIIGDMHSQLDGHLSQVTINTLSVYKTYGRKSADRTTAHFDVIFLVLLSTFFGNFKACYAKTCNHFYI